MIKKLAQHWNTIQATLFPVLEKELGPISSNHQRLITAIEFATVESLIGMPPVNV